MTELRHHVIGVDELVSVAGGPKTRYVNFDNAATTPVMRSALAAVEDLLPQYASVHRGSGHKARVCTEAYESARRSIGSFVGADADRDVVIFTKNTTEAINKLARATAVDDDSVVLTTVLEHHSNDLPWRARVHTVHVGARADGTLDVDDLDRQLTRHAGRIAVLVVSGASNVTGVVQPIHDLARKVHAVGGRILVDAAQLAPHRRIDMRSHDDPEHLDFVALSAHKLYAPFGSGALVGRRDGFTTTPDHCGGGTVDAVTLDEIAWADLPYREEAGTPNLLGAVAFAAAARTLTEIGWDRIVTHESQLVARALAGLGDTARVRIHGPTGTDAITSKVGVISFTVDGMDHGLVAAVLGFEHGIGVRSGCFCAHPYVAHLLGLDAEEVAVWVKRVRDGSKRGAPGMVRMSFGLYNDVAEVDRALGALDRIVRGDIACDYYWCDDDGEYRPVGWDGADPGGGRDLSSRVRQLAF
jgi:selenocysteine lyase/cysteine desulfurase